MTNDAGDRATSPDVLLVDPDRLFREAMSNVLNHGGFNVVETAASLEELSDDSIAERLREGRDVLVIVDFDENNPVAVERAGFVMKQWPEIKVIVVAREVTTMKLRLALDLGVHACLTKDISFESFQRYVRLVMHGESVFPIGLAKSLVASLEPSWTRASPEDSMSNLTTRELSILECLTEGASNKVIARRLGVSDATVKVNIKTLLRKINVSNRTQAATWAVHKGIGSKDPLSGNGGHPSEVGNVRARSDDRGSVFLSVAAS